MRSSGQPSLFILSQNQDPSQDFVQTLGAVDLHFHGAFGVDCMTASETDLNRLSKKLWQRGVAAFCPTTLSEQPAQLLRAVRRIGTWIRSFPTPIALSGAIPLGIHLEGPFIHPAACGAHLPKTIRPLSFKELNQLWDASQNTLKILTLAPELLTSQQLSRLVNWSEQRGISLSLGHSRADLEQARAAFNQGIRGVTHAWNALPFHHRAPGPLGAAIGRSDVFLELIPDQVHVDPVLLRWTQQLHPLDRICFVSDCAPAAATRKGTFPFGPLKVTYRDRASRLPGGELAGGGLLLPEAYSHWLRNEAIAQKRPLRTIFYETIQGLTSVPLSLLRMDLDLLPALNQRQVLWNLKTGNYKNFECTNRRKQAT